jgi:hypothetical protein
MSLFGRYISDQKAEEIKRMANLSFILAKRQYESVNLIGDKKGIEILKHLEWSSISDELEELPEGYEEVWSLSKLKAYNIIAQKGEPFFHIDFDFFLLKKLSDEIKNAQVVFQNIETNINIDLKYNTDAFNKEVKYQPLSYNATNISTNPRSIAYNCGIVGGRDVEFIKLYSDLAIECVLSEENKSFWQREYHDLKKQYPNFESYSKAVLAEQYYAALVAGFNRPINYIKFLTCSNYYPRIKLNCNFIHLLGCSKHLLVDLKSELINSKDYNDIADKIIIEDKEL